jgi:hypothetical protein
MRREWTELALAIAEVRKTTRDPGVVDEVTRAISNVLLRRSSRFNTNVFLMLAGMPES